MGASLKRIRESMDVKPTARDKGLMLTLRLVAYDNGIVELDGIPVSQLPDDDGWLAGAEVALQTMDEFRRQVVRRRKAAEATAES